MNYESDNVIGILEIDETKLPPRPDWVLSLGYITKDGVVKGDEFVTTDYELFTVSVQSDKDYAKYLKSLHCYDF